MKNLTKIIALTVGLLTVSAYADSNTKDMYFGIGVAQSKTKDTDEGITAKYKKINYKALIGKRLNDNMSVELQYTDFAKDNLETTSATITASMSGTSIGVVGLYHFNLQTNYSPFVKVGMHSWDLKAKTNGGSSKKIDGHDVLYGIGLDGKINDFIKYRLEFERMDVDSDMDNIGVGLLVDF